MFSCIDDMIGTSTSGSALPVGESQSLNARRSSSPEWRPLAAGDEGFAETGISRLCRFLADAPESPIVRFTPEDADIFNVIDQRAVFQSTIGS